MILTERRRELKKRVFMVFMHGDDLRRNNLARYASAKKALKKAGISCACGSGHGAYGTAMLLVRSTLTDIALALMDKPYFSTLLIRPWPKTLNTPEGL
jgi:hypothetical protein